MSRSKIKLLTFDITNTLIRVTGPPGHHYADAAAVYGIKVSMSDINDIYWDTWRKKNIEQPNFGVQNGFTSKQWWDDLVRRCFHGIGVKLEHDTLHKLCNQLWESYSKPQAYEMIPSATTLLDTLYDKSYKMGVISNFDERLEKVMLGMNLMKYFQFVVTSVHASHAKPSPEIFELALESGKVAPDEAIHIGDSIIKDYLGAREVGMNAILFVSLAPGRAGPTPRELEKVNPNHIIYDLQELEKTVAKFEAES